MRKSPMGIVYPGSFNPLHLAHKQIMEITSKELGIPVCLEKTIKNADNKASVDIFQVERWINETRDYTSVISSCPKFIDKTEFLLKTIVQPPRFIVGLDTFKRIIDPRFISPGEILFFIDNDVQFIVFSRHGALIDLRLSRREDRLIHPISYNHQFLNFNNPISSSDIRIKNEK